MIRTAPAISSILRRLRTHGQLGPMQTIAYNTSKGCPDQLLPRRAAEWAKQHPGQCHCAGVLSFKDEPGILAGID